MGSTMFVIFALLLPISSSPWLPAQDVVLPGSKAQGDSLRGGIPVSEHLFANNDGLTPNCPWRGAGQM